jgi:hypothetical protein
LGTKTFVAEIRDTFIKPKKIEPEKPQEKPLRRLAPSRRVLKAIMTVFNVELRDILARPSARRNDARLAAIYFLRMASHLSYAQIGRMMGGIRRSYLSRVCRPSHREIPIKWKAVRRILEGKRET